MKHLLLIIVVLFEGLQLYSQNVKFEFPFSPKNLEWFEYKTPKERIDALQIPEKTLGAVSTSDLLEVCLHFPYLTDFFFGNTLEEGLQGVVMEFNGFQELFKRSDFCDVLVSKTRNLAKEIDEIDYITFKGKLSVQYLIVELLLCQKFVMDTMTSKEKESLKSIILSNDSIMESQPTLFGFLNMKVSNRLYSLLSNESNENLLTVNGNNDYDPINVYTPFGSLVPNTGIWNGGDDIVYDPVLYNTILADFAHNYPNDTIVGNPSYTYNCHGYAWHMVNNVNPVFIGIEDGTAEDIYWLDGSYVEVPESLATVVSYSGNHSALRISNNLYISKWGSSFLVKHAPNDVPYTYAPLMPKRYFKPAMEISGPSLVCDTATFGVANLRSNMSVIWDLKNHTFSSNSNLFKPNYPTSNVCTIKGNQAVSYNDTLLAHIYVNNIKTVTLSYPIQSLAKFCCDLVVHQTGAGFSIIPPYAYDGNNIGVPADALVTLSSPKIKNMSIGHTGLTPNNFNVDHTTGEITFSIPSYAIGQTLVVSGDSYTNCEHFNIIFRIGNNYPIIKPNKPTLFLCIGGDENREENVSPNGWDIQIYQVKSNQNIFIKHVTSSFEYVDINSWDSGFYVVTITLDGMKYSRTICIQ